MTAHDISDKDNLAPSQEQELGLALEDWQLDEVEELEEENDFSKYDGISIVHREWTVQTIVDQIKKNRIKLDPPYQRRGVWTDRRRSLLIDSLIVGLPVPEIVLAEIPGPKGSFAVIDGKQRLQTLAGFLFPSDFPDFWSKPKLNFAKQGGMSERGILREQLHGKTYEELDEAQRASLENASIRCTFVTGYRDEVVLYTLFHRLNSQSVALNMQELRQSLYHGSFSKFIVDVTSVGVPVPLHRVMGMSKADNRFRDTELLLRYIGISLFHDIYDGNLRRFLDYTMQELNASWNKREREVQAVHTAMNQGIEAAERMFENIQRVGRRYNPKSNSFDKRFNKVLFEVEVYYFARLGRTDFSDEERRHFLSELGDLMTESEFSQAIGDTTKGLNEYRIRYTRFQDLFRRVFGVTIDNPFKMQPSR